MGVAPSDAKKVMLTKAYILGVCLSCARKRVGSPPATEPLSGSNSIFCSVRSNSDGSRDLTSSFLQNSSRCLRHGSSPMIDARAGFSPAAGQHRQQGARDLNHYRSKNHH
jgi:hypothetical protein